MPTVFTVTTTDDILHDTSAVTLRDALTAIITQATSGKAAAGTAGANTIDFAIGTQGSLQQIYLSSALPIITNTTKAISVFIDGSSQGGTNYTGPPRIVLNGASAGPGLNGLNFAAGSSGGEVKGLVIQGFNVNGIVINATSGNLIVGNYIGTDTTGDLNSDNGVGVFIENGAKGNTVGGASSGAANVISGNSSDGVYLGGSGTSGNVVLGNFIGTDFAGTAYLSNTTDGVVIQNHATGNTVGGTSSGAANVISGNGANGVYLSGSGTTGNVVLGNLIGTDITARPISATPPTACSSRLARRGIRWEVRSGSAANVISGNGANGVYLSGSGTSWQRGAGQPHRHRHQRHRHSRQPRRWRGHPQRRDANTVGGTASGAANVITGNGGGVYLYGGGTCGNVVLGNLIGTDIHGTANLGNASGGDTISMACHRRVRRGTRWRHGQRRCQRHLRQR